MTDRKLTPTSREDVIQAIQRGMLFDGRKRAHHWDRINAQVAGKLSQAGCPSGLMRTRRHFR